MNPVRRSNRTKATVLSFKGRIPVQNVRHNQSSVLSSSVVCAEVKRKLRRALTNNKTLAMTLAEHKTALAEKERKMERYTLMENLFLPKVKLTVEKSCAYLQNITTCHVKLLNAMQALTNPNSRLSLGFESGDVTAESFPTVEKVQPRVLHRSPNANKSDSCTFAETIPEEEERDSSELIDQLHAMRKSLCVSPNSVEEPPEAGPPLLFTEDQEAESALNVTQRRTKSQKSKTSSSGPKVSSTLNDETPTFSPRSVRITRKSSAIGTVTKEIPNDGANVAKTPTREAENKNKESHCTAVTPEDQQEPPLKIPGKVPPFPTFFAFSPNSSKTTSKGNKNAFKRPLLPSVKPKTLSRKTSTIAKSDAQCGESFTSLPSMQPSVLLEPLNLPQNTTILNSEDMEMTECLTGVLQDNIQCLQDNVRNYSERGVKGDHVADHFGKEQANDESTDLKSAQNETVGTHVKYSTRSKASYGVTEEPHPLEDAMDFESSKALKDHQECLLDQESSLNLSPENQAETEVPQFTELDDRSYPDSMGSQKSHISEQKTSDEVAAEKEKLVTATVETHFKDNASRRKSRLSVVRFHPNVHALVNEGHVNGEGIPESVCQEKEPEKRKSILKNALEHGFSNNSQTGSSEEEAAARNKTDRVESEREQKTKNTRKTDSKGKKKVKTMKDLKTSKPIFSVFNKKNVGMGHLSKKFMAKKKTAEELTERIRSPNVYDTFSPSQSYTEEIEKYRCKKSADNKAHKEFNSLGKNEHSEELQVSSSSDSEDLVPKKSRWNRIQSSSSSEHSDTSSRNKRKTYTKKQPLVSLADEDDLLADDELKEMKMTKVTHESDISTSDTEQKGRNKSAFRGHRKSEMDDQRHVSPPKRQKGEDCKENKNDTSAQPVVVLHDVCTDEGAKEVDKRSEEETAKTTSPKRLRRTMPRINYSESPANTIPKSLQETKLDSATVPEKNKNHKNKDLKKVLKPLEEGAGEEIHETKEVTTKSRKSRRTRAKINKEDLVPESVQSAEATNLEKESGDQPGSPHKKESYISTQPLVILEDVCSNREEMQDSKKQSKRSTISVKLRTNTEINHCENSFNEGFGQPSEEIGVTPAVMPEEKKDALAIDSVENSNKDGKIICSKVAHDAKAMSSEPKTLKTKSNRNLPKPDDEENADQITGHLQKTDDGQNKDLPKAHLPKKSRTKPKTSSHHKVPLADIPKESGDQNHVMDKESVHDVVDGENQKKERNGQHVPRSEKENALAETKVNGESSHAKSEDPSSASGHQGCKPRRNAAKALSFVEPKLNSKLRQGDTFFKKNT